MGRPPRISRASIAEAARDLGLDGLTMRAVADRLGVGVPSLYHHVRGRDDLLQLVADHAVEELRLPDDHGQHWAVWLLEWARYNRDAFVAQPALLGQFLEGAISAEVIARSTEVILEVLCRQGFDVDEAQEAYLVVSTCAMGEALRVLRDARVTDDRRRELLAATSPDELPYLRSLAARPDVPAPFEERVVTVLAGIAARRGDPREDILGLLPTAR